MIARAVPLTKEQADFLHYLGVVFGNVGDLETEKQLLDIAAAWKVSPVVSFECDVDESGGLAEVVELNGYSRKAPCA